MKALPVFRKKFASQEDEGWIFVGNVVNYIHAAYCF